MFFMIMLKPTSILLFYSSRDSLAFATEPVFGSLSNVFNKHENFTSGMPPHLKDFEMYAVEKVYGLLQVSVTKNNCLIKNSLVKDKDVYFLCCIIDEKFSLYSNSNSSKT